MSKKISLASALQRASGKKSTVIDNTVYNQIISSVDRPPCRVGKKTIAGYFDIAVSQQLKMIAVHRHQSVQNMLAEALNDFFEKHNLKPIA